MTERSQFLRVAHPKIRPTARISGRPRILGPHFAPPTALIKRYHLAMKVELSAAASLGKDIPLHRGIATPFRAPSRTICLYTLARCLWCLLENRGRRAAPANAQSCRRLFWETSATGNSSGLPQASRTSMLPCSLASRAIPPSHGPDSPQCNPRAEHRVDVPSAPHSPQLAITVDSKPLTGSIHRMHEPHQNT